MAKRKPGARVRAWELEKAKDLLREGKSVNATSEATGISRSKIYEIRRDHVPRLQLGSVSVDVWTDQYRIARYATVEVAVVSKVDAVDCEAWCALPLRGLSFPLHWAGTQYTPEEFGAPCIVIRPDKPARLDVAFALPAPGLPNAPSVTERTLTSGQVVGMWSGGEAKYVPDLAWTGQGCWIGEPRSLYNPDPRAAAYCTPGRYRIRITVRCAGGEGDSAEYDIESPMSWQNLRLTPA